MSLLRKLNINNKSLISVKQFTNNDIINIFELANKFKKHYIKHGNSFVNYNNNKGIGLLFFQPSTRTRMSFEIAAKNIGLNALLETNPTNNLSIAKQESLSDTLKTMSQYVDTIILRHPDDEEVFNNIENINIPIINAGWGEFEHPTQALIDLYTFKHNVKSLKNTNLAIVGDPNTRTAKSITELASKFNMSISYIYPDIYSHNINNISVNKLIANNHNDFQKAVQNQDILYYSNFTGTATPTATSSPMQPDWHIAPQSH